MAKKIDSTNTPETPVNQENFDKMVEDGKSVDAINQVVQENMRKIQTDQESRLKTEQVTAAVAAKKEKQVQNLQFMEGEFETFKPNRTKFAQWAEAQMGNDETGLEVIANIAANLPRLKTLYGTFLKTTVDFSQKISEATNRGQTMGQLKQSLQPVPSSGAAPAKPELQPAQTQITPTDDALNQMEGHLGMSRARSSFYVKR